MFYGQIIIKFCYSTHDEDKSVFADRFARIFKSVISIKE